MAAFKEWTRSEGLESSCGIDQFKGVIIAFDAEDYLNSLLTTTRTREPLLPALGGLPFALQKHVDEDLRTLRDAEIRPIFIFNGLEPASKDKAMVGREARKAAKSLDEAWSIYDQGRGDDAVVAFGKACTYKTYHISRWLQMYLHRSDVLIQTAPYTAAAQLVYLLQTGWAQAVYGSADCLAFGADKVITSFSADSRNFSYVDFKAVQGKLMFTLDPAIDWLLLSGCTNLLPAFPDVETEPPVARLQRTRHLMTQTNGDGHALCMAHKNDDYTSAFRKARAVIAHPIMLKQDGKVETKNPKNAPNDSHDFVGARLPEELYYYLSRGVAGPRVLNWHVTSQIIETPPLDGGNSGTYKDLITNKLVDLHTQALNVIAAVLHRYVKNKVLPIDLCTWFNDDKKPISIKEAGNPLDTAGTWHVPDATLRSSEANTSPLTAAINLLSDEDAAKPTVTKRGEHAGPPLSRPAEMLANTVFRFLHDRGYVNNDHTLSPWGVALKVSLDRAQSNGYVAATREADEAEEAILMAFELLRLKLLNTQNMFPTTSFSGQPLRGSQTDKENTLLISRVACLGLFRHQAIGYTGPLSRHLLAYHQMASAVRLSLRDLLEMHACTLLMSGAMTRDTTPKQLTELGASLPLGREPDLGLALVVKSYLDEQSNEPSKRADITRWFNYVLDLDSDLEKAWKMWDAINAGVQAADISSLTDDKKTFKAADDWLHKKLASTNGATTNGATTNGTA